MDERLECAWIFTSIAMGSHEQTMAVVPMVPLLAACMTGDSVALAEHSAWTIGAVRESFGSFHLGAEYSFSMFPFLCRQSSRRFDRVA